MPFVATWMDLEICHPERSESDREGGISYAIGDGLGGIVRESGVDLLLLFSHSVVSDSFGTPWTAARPAPLFMGFSRQQYGSGLPFPSPGNLPVPGTEPMTPELQTDSLSLSHLGRLLLYIKRITNGSYCIQHRELCSVLCASLDGGQFGGEWIHLHVWLSPSTADMKLSQHC